MLLANVYVAGLTTKPFIVSKSCVVTAVFPILVPISMPSVLNLNELLTPSTKHLIECPTPDPCDVKSIVAPPTLDVNSMVFASITLT